jgi:hypothetical protein
MRTASNYDGFLLHYSGAIALVVAGALASFPAHAELVKFLVLFAIFVVLLGNVNSCFSEPESHSG